MKLSELAIPSIRFGLWAILGTHMYATGMEVDSPIMAFIAGLVMYSYAGSIILEAIFKMNKESKHVREDQELDAEDESGGVSPSDAEGPQKR